ncbi:hypothetical protein FF1_017452 [Malus domestica]
MGLGSLEGCDEGDAVAVRFVAPANVGGAGGDVGVPGRLAVVHVGMMMLETYLRVMHPPPVTWTLTPQSSMVLKLLTMSSYLSLMVMSAEKMIQRDSFWMTAWRSVPGVGFAGLESEESVTM